MTMFSRLSLFEAMDTAIDLLYFTNCDYRGEDNEPIFRKLQRQKVLGLSPEQVRELFAEWEERYRAKVELDRRTAIAKLTRFAEAHARENPDPTPFRCPCGAETKSAHDPDFFAIHWPHIAEAGAEARRKSA